MIEYKMRKEDTSPMNAFQRQNFKLDDPIGQDESGQKGQCDRKPTTAREAEPSYNNQTSVFLMVCSNQCIFKINSK